VDFSDNDGVVGEEVVPEVLWTILGPDEKSKDLSVVIKELLL
jgi:hypothetical protein